MGEITVNPQWRTSTVVELCRSMREAQDFSALPILADALQDADCDAEVLLALLRKGPAGYADCVSLVACVMSEETANAVGWLKTFAYSSDCPGFSRLLEAAAGRTSPSDADDYFYVRNDGDYLHFSGSNAHGEIPALFWDMVQLITGKLIHTDERARYFSCSC